MKKIKDDDLCMWLSDDICSDVAAAIHELSDTVGNLHDKFHEALECTKSTPGTEAFKKEVHPLCDSLEFDVGEANDRAFNKLLRIIYNSASQETLNEGKRLHQMNFGRKTKSK